MYAVVLEGELGGWPWRKVVECTESLVVMYPSPVGSLGGWSNAERLEVL